MAKSTFEAEFKSFVLDFGGEIVPESKVPGESSADYVFREYNVVAELKSFVADQAAATKKKLSEILKRRIAEQGFAVSPSAPDLDVPILHCTMNGENFDIPFDEKFQQAWLNVLFQTFESRIRNANQQIGATKERLCLPSAHGLVLLFNEGNPLHAASPQHAGRLFGELIQKPGRFPHIQGLVYFSLRVPTFDQQTQKHMPFWFPAQVRGDSVEAVQHFQEDLKRGWFQYIEKMSGVAVVRHRRETGWPK